MSPKKRPPAAPPKPFALASVSSPSSASLPSSSASPPHGLSSSHAPAATVLPLHASSPPSYRAALRPIPPAPSLSAIDIARLRRDYPTGVRVPAAIVSEGIQPWNLTLIGKFLGRPPSVDRTSSALAIKWALEGEFQVFPINYGFFYFKFANPRDRDHAFTGGPWVVDDATLALELWSASFVPSPSRLPSTVLWMGVPDLPIVGWSARSLELIASAAGRLVRLDESTSDLSKLRYARMAIEVDTSAPLVPGTMLEFEGVDLPPFWQRFEYEHVHLFCPLCGRLGHLHFDCKYVTPGSSSPVSAANLTPNASSSPVDMDIASAVPTVLVADDETPAPPAWIVQRRRGFGRKQPLPLPPIADAPSRDASRDLAAPLGGRDPPRGWPKAHRPTMSNQFNAAVASSELRVNYVGPLPVPTTVPSSAADPSDRNLGSGLGLDSSHQPGASLCVDSGFGVGLSGPLGPRDPPTLVGAVGLQNTGAAGLLGSAPTGALPLVDQCSAVPTNLGVFPGAGRTEAALSTPTSSSVPAELDQIPVDSPLAISALRRFKDTLSAHPVMPSAQTCAEVELTIAQMVKGRKKKKIGSKTSVSRRKKKDLDFHMLDAISDDEDCVDEQQILDLLAAGADPDVLWSANRDHPVSENATLQFSHDGDLILRDADGTKVWSTGTAGRSVAGMRVVENGRLELFDNKNVSVWDSFDYPTDTWLRGQTLREGQQLIANALATNFTRGQYYLSVVSGGLEAYIDSEPPQLYYQNKFSPWNKSTYISFTNGSLNIFSSAMDTPNYDNPIVYLQASSLQFMRLEFDGHLRHYEWDTHGWTLLDDVFAAEHTVWGSSQLDDCAYPNVCGEYGFCSNGECSCLDFTYFRQVDARQMNRGCYPVTPLTCQSNNNHHLIPLANVSYFNYNDMNAAIFQSTNEEQCKQACLRNCSCKAAFFKFTEDSSNGSCYLPSRLYSVMSNNPQVSGYKSSAYIKVQIQKKGPELAVILGVTLAALFVVAIAIGCIVLRMKRKLASKLEKEDNFELVSGLPTRFSFEDLKVANENFSRKLGQGGFGSVFEGTMNGEQVAVKRLDSVGQGIKEFLAEVRTIGNIHHINLVRLKGFCSERSCRLLVYEYMCNGSLDKWIFCRNKGASLNWQTRVQIITDVAKGLSYLHEDCRQRIVHLDIKPQNILLDHGFHAKISDFGLAKLIDREQSYVWTAMRGTQGYLAPEWLTSKITEKADVYSFGVVVMEIVCGRKNLDYSQPEEQIHLISLLQDKVKESRKLDIVDNHSNDMQLHTDETIKMIKLAMWCLQNDSTRRPSMSVVVKVLDGSINVETNIDYNFTNPTPRVPENVHGLGASATPSASLLSGGR